MVRRFVILTVLCIVSVARADDSTSARNAVDQYNQALRAPSDAARGSSLSESGHAFTAHLRDGFDNPATHFNLGVVALRQGHIGVAIAEFSVAHRQQPRSERIATALAFARNRMNTAAPANGVPQFVGALMSWHTGLSTPETAWAFLLIWFGGCSVLALARWYRNRALFRLGVVGACIACCFAGSLLVKTCFASQTAVVTVPEAAVRSGAGDHFPETYRLPDGTECALLQSLPGWRQIRIAGKDTGWIADRESAVF